MSTILVADDESLYRELVVKILTNEGFTVVAASNGREALAVMMRQPTNLVLLDLVMPQASGVEVLRAMRRHEKLRAIPVIVVTGLMNREALRDCAKLGVRDLLLKANFSLSHLLERIHARLHSAAPLAGLTPMADPATNAGASDRRIALPLNPELQATPKSRAPTNPDEIPRLLTREETLRRVEEYTQSKTLAGVVAQVIGITSSPRASVTDLVALLKRDVVLASRVLQVANTAAFATNKPHVATIEEAVRNVGLSTVRNIATSVGIIEAFPSDGADGFNLIRCWQHSFAVAAILQRLMPDSKAGPGGAGVAHLVGLCHELGEIVLRQCFAEQHAKAVAVAQETGKEQHEVETIMFGVRHCELVAQIMGRLALPPDIVNPIQEYLERGRGRTAGSLSTLAQALRLADAYAHGLLLCSSPNAVVQPFAMAECRRVTKTAEPPQIGGTCLRTEVLLQTSLLSRLSRDDEAKLSKPMFERSTLSVWYARHPSLSSFDPLAAALEALADVRIESRLPNPKDAPGMLVVAVPREGLGGFTLAEVQKQQSESCRGSVLFLAGSDVPQASIVGDLEVAQYPISLAKLAAALQRVRLNAEAEEAAAA